MALATLAVTMLATFVLVEFLKKLVPALDGPLLQAIVFVLGFGMVFLMAETQWANTEVFRGISLDAMNFATKLVTGIFVGAGATGIDRALEAIKNVGENQPPNVE